MRSSRFEMKKTKVEIIPMIDTMFFLLVFFILQSVDIIKMKGISINLPKPSSAPTQEKPKTPQLDELVISVSPGGDVTVNGKPVMPENIGPILQSELELQIAKKHLPMNIEQAIATATVVISADPASQYNLMVRCIDQARDKGFTSFAIAALQPDQLKNLPVRPAPQR